MISDSAFTPQTACPSVFIPCVNYVITHQKYTTINLTTSYFIVKCRIYLISAPSIRFKVKHDPTLFKHNTRAHGRHHYLFIYLLNFIARSTLSIFSDRLRIYIIQMLKIYIGSSHSEANFDEITVDIFSFFIYSNDICGLI